MAIPPSDELIEYWSPVDEERGSKPNAAVAFISSLYREPHTCPKRWNIGLAENGSYRNFSKERAFDTIDAAREWLLNQGYRFARHHVDRFS